MQTAWYRVFCTLLAVATCVGVLGCAQRLLPPAVPASAEPTIPKQLQPRQVIVTLAAAPAAQWAQTATALAQTYALPQVGAFPLASLGVQCLVFQIPPERSMERLLTQLQADPRVESVQINHVFIGLNAPYNDPYASLQYGAHTMRADGVHALATGKGVTIAVVDTGVDTAHTDLQGRIVQTINFVEGGEQSFAQDRHGTAVTGVIAANANNSTGIVGIAPEADIIAIKACWHRTPQGREALCSSWTLAKALDYVLLTPVHLLNMSLAGPPDPLLTRLITTAVEHGITVVAAVLDAGEHAPGFPASLGMVIATLACDMHGRVRSPSGGQRGQFVAAPGVEILTTTPHGTYDFVSGSSLAAAHVTGLAALLLERQPSLSPAQVYDLLRTTASPVQSAGGATGPVIGIVDACRALAQLTGTLHCP
jgi:subtilisin family serine protease